jgi:hypothetical protein
MKARLFTASTFLVSVALLALLVPDGAWLAVAQLQPAGRPALISAEAPAENVELVGHIGGVTYAVFVQGNCAYIGEGPGLVVLDVSNPASLAVASQSAVFPFLLIESMGRSPR